MALEKDILSKNIDKLLYFLLSDKMLDLIIFTTEKCNFRCRYCYEDFSIGKMDPDVVEGVCAFIRARAPDLDILTINFFGGEPLLAHEWIYRICEEATLAVERWGKLKYHAMATTNGYLLTEEKVRKYYDVGLRRYQISLDGDSDTHNQWRVMANGRGTFEKIWGNILMMRDLPLDLEVLLRIHVLPETVYSVENLITRIAKELDGDHRFKIFLKEIVHLGGDNDNSIDVFNTNSREYKVAMDYLRSLINPIHQEKSGSAAQNIYDNVCYASRANSLVIRANGDVGKCTVALKDPRNRIGRLDPDGRLHVDGDKLTSWIRGVWSLDPEELHCPLIGLLR